MKFNKSLLAALLALVLVVSCGVIEVVAINNRYKELNEVCETLLEKVDDESLTFEEFGEFQQSWLKLREISEFLLPHLDIYEINMRIVEASAYVKKEDWDSAYAQLVIVNELLAYIPDKMVPNFYHVF